MTRSDESICRRKGWQDGNAAIRRNSLTTCSLTPLQSYVLIDGLKLKNASNTSCCKLRATFSQALSLFTGVLSFPFNALAVPVPLFICCYPYVTTHVYYIFLIANHTSLLSSICIILFPKSTPCVISSTSSHPIILFRFISHRSA